VLRALVKKRLSGAFLERGTSMVMVITMLPVIFGMFGLGIDTMRMVWMRASLQNELDQAVASGAAVSMEVDPSSGNVLINQDMVRERVRTLYARNRDKYHMKCNTPTEAPMLIPGSTETRCWDQYDRNSPGSNGIVYGSPRVISNGTEVVYGVVEETNTFFLKVVGVDTQTYYIQSRAAITPSDVL
jgi:Putative Flp pilus-assembly TadE/G-like